MKNEVFSGYLYRLVDALECSTFPKLEVAKLSSGLFPPAFVITTIMFMNGANVVTKLKL